MFNSKISLTRTLSIALIWLLANPGTAIAQTVRVDSLKKELTDLKDNKSEILYEIAFEFSKTGRYDSCLNYGRKALNFALQNHDTLRWARAMRINAHSFRQMNQMDSAIDIATRVIPVAREKKYFAELKNILNGLGVAYTYKGLFDKALEVHFESLEIREKYGTDFEISVSLLNIGVVYYKLTDYTKALGFFNSSLALKTQIGDSLDLALVSNNLAICYAYLDKFEEAQEYLNQAIRKCGEECPDLLKVQISFTEGYIHFAQDKFDLANHAFLKSYATAKQIGDRRLELDNIIHLSRISFHLGKSKETENHLRAAQQLIRDGTPFNMELIKIYAEFFRLYSKMQDFEKASFYQSKYIMLKDSLFGDKFTTRIMKIEAAYLEKENLKKVEAKNEILLLKEQVIYRQQIFNLAVAIACLLLVALVFMLWRTVLRKKRINQILDLKVKDRTKELEVNRDALQRAAFERDALISKASIDIRSSIATIKGLCLLGMKEIEHPSAQDYLEKVDKTSDQLSNVINRIFTPYKIGDPSK